MNDDGMDQMRKFFCGKMFDKKSMSIWNQKTYVAHVQSKENSHFGSSVNICIKKNKRKNTFCIVTDENASTDNSQKKSHAMSRGENVGGRLVVDTHFWNGTEMKEWNILLLILK